ncbi:uncharacterized protein LOC115008245 isoform X1 [Cottoperca gobio]|uniref:Uncharacterized protein LOC115008245 isoform X1 n=1 Tax=Cottoperca gobio TaxID=56716 RepID=A0A6J2PR57_COTGO|nr:uncharacterized protein LOC115008245 isoform X1 [Cottoperca gobio]
MTEHLLLVILMYSFLESYAQALKPEVSLQHFPGEYVFMTCTLPGSAHEDTRCNLYFGEERDPFQTTTILKQRTSKNQRFCQFTVTISDLLTRLHFPQRSVTSCDYSLGSEPNSLSPRSDGYRLTDIVERESSAPFTKPVFPMTTDLIVGRPGASATPVKLESDIVDKETHSTQTMATSTMTTGRTVSRLHASTPITRTKRTLGQNVGSSNTGSFISTSITPVKPTSVGQTPHKSSTKASLLHVTPIDPPTAETWTWNLVVVAACLGGVILLGLALLFTKRRTERCSSKRPKVNVTALQGGYDETYSIVTYECNTE